MKVDKAKWEKCKLEDLCTNESSNIVISKVEIGRGNYSLFGASGLIGKINFYQQERPYLGIVKDGSGVGRVAKYPSFTSLVGTMQYILPKENVDIDYLHYLLVSLNLDKYVKGAAIPHIYFRHYKLEKTYLPPLSDQQTIATELDSIQTIIDGYKAQLEDLDALAQSIFLDTFGDPISNPKKWKKDVLKKHASIGTGSTPSRKKALYYEGNIPWVKSTEVHNSYIYETQEYITQEAIDNSNCTIYLPNTILIAMYGQGKTRGQVGLLKIKAATNQACAAVYCKDSLDYLFCYWHLQICYEANRKLGNGTNQKNMNLSIVGNIKFIIPPLSLQQQYAKQVEAIEKQKDLLREQLKDAETLMAERMQYYFS